MERFADVLDMAQAHVEQETALQIERIRKGAGKGTGSTHCVDCGAEIPNERRRHMPGAVRCVPCQDLMERIR
jgi:phage/conjugal plasmid C-4 type zinc finger TraR family protein